MSHLAHDGEFLRTNRDLTRDKLIESACKSSQVAPPTVLLCTQMASSHVSALRFTSLWKLGGATPGQLCSTVVEQIAANNVFGRKLTFGVVSALWVISSGICSMISFLNSAHHVREARPWFKVRAIALGLSLLISILLLTALFMVLVGSHFVGWLGTGLGLHPMVVLAWKGIQWPTAILFVSISCSLIYYCGPNVKERRRWQWFTPGSAFGGFVWLAASFGFRIYLHFFDNYSTSYGSLGAVMILLVWLYVSGLACLIGAEINAEIECAARSRGRDACARGIE